MSDCVLALAVAGATNEPTVTSSLLTSDEAAEDVVVETLPEKVALDWHNISCSIYKVHQNSVFHASAVTDSIHHQSCCKHQHIQEAGSPHLCTTCYSCQHSATEHYSVALVDIMIRHPQLQTLEAILVQSLRHTLGPLFMSKP